MRNLLAFVGGLIVTFAVVGWYLDWFRFVGVSSGDPGRTRVEFDINQDKIRRDVEAGLRRGKEQLDGMIEKGPAAEQAKTDKAAQ
jgi:hypothetical protein